MRRWITEAIATTAVLAGLAGGATLATTAAAGASVTTHAATHVVAAAPKTWFRG